MAENKISNPFRTGQLEDKIDTSLVKGIAIGVTALLVVFYASGIYLNILQIKKLKGK
jgi:hypothetical protein